MKLTRILELLSHATIVLSGMFTVFFFIDKVNPAMGFIDSGLSKAVLLLFCICAMASSILAVYCVRSAQRAHSEKKSGEQFNNQP